MRLILGLLLTACALQAVEPPESGGVLVVAASARDYVLGAGGALAKRIDAGAPVYVVIFGNGDKSAVGLSPSEARKRNRAEAEAAGRKLGVRETLFLGYSEGYLAQISSSELRNQLMALFRIYKPDELFFPDWYVHYISDDAYRVGRMAEEAPYGGGSLFLQEYTYMDRGGYAPREYFFYAPDRPYREREGGEGRADFVGEDVGSTFARKLAALAELATSNTAWAKPGLDASSYARGFATELAETIGRRHGYARAEEFNHLGRGGGVPEHVREHARSAR
ncbi:MAG: PIG-L family deacetylase [Bryobacterales bacterium]